MYQSLEQFQDSKVLLAEYNNVVFTNGCFDILHAGHIDCLARSRGYGDILIVGLNSDDSVKRLKGKTRPIHKWKQRATVLYALSSVDIVIGFNEDTPIELIRSLRPDIITKGGDYKMEDMIGKDFVESYGGSVLLLPLLKGISTTDIIRKLEK